MTASGCLTLRVRRPAEPHLHAIHGLTDLVQVVGGAKCLQTNVRQLELLLPQLVLQLEDDLSLGLGAFTQPVTGITHTHGGGGVT